MSTPEEFIALFSRFYEPGALFVVTRAPRSVGTKTLFAITLSNGKPMVRGAGEVVESYAHSGHRFGRPGMLLRLGDLTDDSRAVVKSLEQALAAASDSGDGAATDATAEPKGKLLPLPAPPPGASGILKLPLPKQFGPVTVPKIIPAIEPKPGSKDGAAKVDAKGDKAKPLRGPDAEEGKDEGKAAEEAATGADKDPRRAAGERQRASEPQAAAKPEPSSRREPPGEEGREPAPANTPAGKRLQLIPGGVTASHGDEDEEDTSVRAPEPAAAPREETRAPSSSFILPANPLTELSEGWLEAFIECSLFEESGFVELTPEELQEAADADAYDPPADPPAPPGRAVTQGTVGSSALGVEDGPDGAAMARPPTAPPGWGPPAVGPAPYAGPPRGHAPDFPGHRPPEPAPPQYGSMPARPVDPSLLLLRPSSSGTWKAIAGTAVATAALTLLIGYFVWGGAKSSAVAAEPAATRAAVAADSETRAVATAPTAPAADDAEPPDPTSASEDLTGLAAEPDDEPADDPADDPEDDLDTDEADDAADEPEPMPSAPAAVVDATACYVQVISDPKEAVVTHKGRKLGSTPFQGELPCGEVKIGISRPRYRDESRTLNLQPGTPAQVSLKLTRPSFSVRIDSLPVGASAYINGRKVGTTPLTTRIEAFRYHNIELRKEGYRPYRGRVYPKEDGLRMGAKLQRER